MDNINEIEAAIRLSRCKGVGAVQFKKLIEKHKLPSLAYREWNKNLSQFIPSKISLTKNSIENQIQITLEALKEGKIEVYYYGHNNYPNSLKALTEPPPIIYLSSKIKEKPLAAVVGTRTPEKQQIEKAKILTKELIEKGYGIVSGGALGIDKVAHETSLKENAYTIAVLANGLDIIYPYQNKELLEKIRLNGLLMSELMLGALPQRGFFPTRNRLIAALADVIVALPSEKSSGTLITIKWGLKLEKKIII